MIVPFAHTSLQGVAANRYRPANRLRPCVHLIPSFHSHMYTDSPVIIEHENNSPVALKSHLQHHHHQQQQQQQQQQIQPSPSTPLTPPLTPASSSTDGLNSSPNPELSSSPVRLLASPSSQGSAAQNNGLKCVTNLGMLPLLRVNVPTVDLVDNPSDDPVVQQSAADIPQAFSNGYSPDRTTEKELQPGRFLLVCIFGWVMLTLLTSIFISSD